MSKVAVVYWSQTGNTKAMADAIAAAASVDAIDYADFTAEDAKDYDAFAFGCPAMGAEELDPDFEALWDSCVPELGDKPVVLFGSYDWGTGDWMEQWKQNAQAAGVNVTDTAIAHLDPDDEARESLASIGKQLAA